MAADDKLESAKMSFLPKYDTLETHSTKKKLLNYLEYLINVHNGKLDFI